MAVELRPHPCKLITDQKAIYVNGVMLGYCGDKPGMPINFIKPFEKISTETVEQVKAKVAEEIGEGGKVSAPVLIDREVEEE